MAKAKNTPTQVADVQGGAGTGNGEQTGAATPTKGKGGRRPGSGEDVLYFNGDRDLALTVLVASHPGQYTSKQVALLLAEHVAFADQRDLILTGAKHESFRQRLIKLNKRWVEKGRPSLELKRLANTNYDVDAILDQAAAQLYGTQGHGQSQQGQPQPVPVQPAGPGPVAGVAASGFTGGLIPTT